MTRPVPLLQLQMWDVLCRCNAGRLHACYKWGCMLLGLGQGLVSIFMYVVVHMWSGMSLGVYANPTL
jgi:hypothetical protein